MQVGLQQSMNQGLCPKHFSLRGPFPVLTIILFSVLWALSGVLRLGKRGLCRQPLLADGAHPERGASCVAKVILGELAELAEPKAGRTELFG